MKPKNLIIVFIFSLFFVANLNSVFADDPCDPPSCTDCEYTDDWHSRVIEYGDFQGCPACSILVTVKYNLECNEVFILNWQPNSACTNCINDSWTYEEIMGEIKWKVLLYGPLPLPAMGCSTVVKLRQYACYSYDVTSQYPFSPCNAACCKEEYEITKSYQGGTPHYECIYLSSQRIGDECPVEEGCFDLCGSPLITPLPKININENQDDGAESIVKSIVYPNPASESAVLEYSCEETGNVLFKIFDVQGNEVYSLEDNKTSESSILNLNINSLTDGIYYYKLLLNNINISTGSLTIIK